jgi:hypothetical protein
VLVATLLVASVRWVTVVWGGRVDASWELDRSELVSPCFGQRRSWRSASASRVVGGKVWVVGGGSLTLSSEQRGDLRVSGLVPFRLGDRVGRDRAQQHQREDGGDGRREHDGWPKSVVLLGELSRSSEKWVLHRQDSVDWGGRGK